MPPLRLALWTTGLAGFALLACALAGRPLGLGWPLGVLLLHATSATLGVVFPELRVWGDAVCRGEPGRRRIALTFDDGPHPETTRRVLGLLEQRRMRATFFVLGCKARKHPELVREIAARGHALGLHGDEHDRFYMLRSAGRIRADLARAARALFDAAGLRTRWFRPPVGFMGHGVALAADAAGLTVVGCSTRGLDGRASARPEAVLKRCVAGLADGAVLLLHDAAEDDDREPASLAILSELLAAIERAGLQTVSVDELFGDPRAPASLPAAVRGE